MVEKVEHAIQDDYPDDFAHCYGCGRLNEGGLKLRTGWDMDQTVTIYTPQSNHTAVPGVVYGGIIASLIDCHGTGSASLALHRKNGHEPGSEVEPPRFVTAFLEVDYIKPTPTSVPLKAIGKVNEIHPKRWEVHAEVFADGECCAKGKIVAVVMPDTFKK